VPLWKVDIEKHYQGEYWSNRYFVEEADLVAAHLFAVGIVNWERALVGIDIDFTRVRTSDVVPDTDNFISTPLQLVGTRPIGGELMPLFCVVRVDFTAGTGRPSRKYLRGVLREADVTQFTVNSALRDLVQTEYAGPLVASSEFVDIDGQTITSSAVHPVVGMRQLRRGSRRRTTPIVP